MLAYINGLSCNIDGERERERERKAFSMTTIDEISIVSFKNEKFTNDATRTHKKRLADVCHTKNDI